MNGRKGISDGLIALILLALVSIPYFASSVGVMNSMDGPQYALTRSIVEKGSLSIDGYHWIRPDYALVDGSKYSKRSPGISFVAVPFYMYSSRLAPVLFPPYLGQPAPGVNDQSPVEAVVYGLVSLVGAASVAVFYMILRQLKASRRSSIFATCLFAFGSLLWSYSPSLIREPLVILLLFLAYWAVLRVKNMPRFPVVVAAGISLGLSIFADNLAILPALILLCWTAYVLHKKAPRVLLVGLLISFAIGLLPLVTYNIHVFHEPFAVAALEYDQNPMFR